MTTAKKQEDKALVILNVLWAIIAAVANYAVNFFITPYITENVGVDAYGFVSLSTTLTSYVDILAIALNAFAGRYISISYHEGDYEKANVYFNSVIVSNILFAIILIIPCSVAIVFLQNILQIPSGLVVDVKVLFIIVLLNYFVTIIGLAFNTATFIKNRLDLSEARKSVSSVIKGILLLILCSVFVPHIWYVGIAYIVASVYILINNIVFTKNLTPELKFRPSVYSYKAVKELLSAGIWNSFNSLGNVLNDGLDLLITNMMLSAESMGQVSVGKNLSTIFNIFLNAVCNAFKPKQLKCYAQNDTIGLINEIKISMKCCSIITCLIFAGFVSCGRYFLQCWIPTQNIDVIYPITCICLAGNLIVGVVTPLYYVYTLTKRLKLPSLITIGMGLANVASMYVLLKYTSLGVYSVVLTTAVLNTGIHFFDAPIYSSICLNVKKSTFYPVILRHFGTAFFTTLVLVGIVRVLPKGNGWIGLGFLAIPCVLIGVFVSVVLTFDRNELSSIYKTLEIKMRER